MRLLTSFNSLFYNSTDITALENGRSRVCDQVYWQIQRHSLNSGILLEMHGGDRRTRRGTWGTAVGVERNRFIGTRNTTGDILPLSRYQLTLRTILKQPDSIYKPQQKMWNVRFSDNDVGRFCGDCHTGLSQDGFALIRLTSMLHLFWIKRNGIFCIVIRIYSLSNALFPSLWRMVAVQCDVEKSRSWLQMSTGPWEVTSKYENSKQVKFHNQQFTE